MSHWSPSINLFRPAKNIKTRAQKPEYRERHMAEEGKARAPQSRWQGHGNRPALIQFDARRRPPEASTTAEIPVFAARTKGRPCSTARKRANARCWCGPALRPNQPSFVRLTSMSGRGLVRAR